METPRVGPIEALDPPPTRKRKSSGTHLIAAYGGDMYAKDKADKKPGGLPRWLFTSQQILKEGTAQMRLKAVWSLDEVDYTYEMPNPPPSNMKLLQPFQMSTLIFEVEGLKARTRRDPVQKALKLLPDRRSKGLLSDEATHLIMQCTQLKSLRIVFPEACTEVSPKAMEKGYPFRLDLSRLSTLLLDFGVQLNKLEFVFAQGIESWFNENTVEGRAPQCKLDRDSAPLCKDYTSVLDAFKNEIARVGEQLVSGRGNGRLVFRETRVAPVNRYFGGHMKGRFFGERWSRTDLAVYEGDEIWEWQDVALRWHFEFTKDQHSGNAGAAMGPLLPVSGDVEPKKTTLEEERGALFGGI